MKLTEIKINNRFHYKLEDSGFWVSLVPTDHMSATVTSGELWSTLESSVKDGQDMIRVMEQRIEYMKLCMKQLEQNND